MYSVESLAEHLSTLLIAAALLLLLLPACVFILAFFSDSVRRFLRHFPVHMQRLRHSFRRKRTTEPRKTKRFATRELRAEITDGRTSYCGLVANISLFGICIRELPEKLSCSRSLISIVVHGKTGQYRLVARPRWETRQANNAKTIGVEIAHSPETWQQFVLSW